MEHLDLEKLPRIIQLADRAQQALDHINFVEDRQLHRHFRQLFEVSGRDRFALHVFKKEKNDEVAMDAISRKTDEHTQIADRPDNVSEASLHGSFRRCQWLRQQGRHDAASSVCVKSKIEPLPLKTAIASPHNRFATAQKTRARHARRIQCLLSIFFIGCSTGLLLNGQEEPLTEQGYEREEL